VKPSPPVTPSPAWGVLEECDAAVGLVLWRVASDVLLWFLDPGELQGRRAVGR
jgi:hypothetical protein